MSGVPCNGCTRCCHRDLITLHEDLGDDPTLYKTEVIAGVVSLAHGPTGDCVYLDRAKGCTIYADRPAVCREFDCAAAYRMLGAKGRAAALAKGIVSQGVIDRGRQLLQNGYRPEALAQRRRLLGIHSRRSKP